MPMTALPLAPAFRRHADRDRAVADAGEHTGEILDPSGT
jgi:hypothetical protein